MGLLNDKERDILIDLCKKRVAKRGMAGVHSVSKDHLSDIGVNDPVGLLEAREIANYFVANDKRFAFDEDKEHEYYIRYDANFELSESVKQTNLNVRRSNRIITTASICTGVFAIAAFVVSFFDFIDAEKLKPSLKQLQGTLQEQVHRQQQIESSLREINQSILILVDSLP